MENNGPSFVFGTRGGLRLAESWVRTASTTGEGAGFGSGGSAYLRTPQGEATVVELGETTALRTKKSRSNVLSTRAHPYSWRLLAV